MTAAVPRSGWSARAALRRMFVPPPKSAAVTRLRLLILLTALATIVVEALNLALADEIGFTIAVRTFWAVARVVGFLFLMRSVRHGMASARPFGLILAVTTIFAVARLAQPRSGDLLPRAQVIAGLVLLTALCSAVVWVLYRSPAIAAYLEYRPARRHLPPSVITARIAVLTYGALVAVPLLVAFGALVSGSRAHTLPITAALLAGWTLLFLVVSVLLPIAAFFLLFGHSWARWMVGLLSVVVLVAQPVFCYLLLGLDGLLRDGVPLVLTALVGLGALAQSRGVPTGHRVRPGAPTGTDAVKDS